MLSNDVVNPTELDDVLDELVEATAVESNTSASQFPRDLEITNNVLNMTVNRLIDDLSSNPNNPIPLSVVSTDTS